MAYPRRDPKGIPHHALGDDWRVATARVTREMWEDIEECTPRYGTYSQTIRELLKMGLDIKLHRDPTLGTTVTDR